MLRSRFLIALLLTFAVATGFFYTRYQAVCPIPLTYRVGTVDASFAIEPAAAEQAVTDAVAAWEQSLSQPVFTEVSEGETADVVINFIFDERQARTDAETRERERLAVVEALSGEVQAAYRAQVEELEAREEAYEVDAAVYERDLARYNATVAEYNEEGGAPPEVYDELEAERTRLRNESARLNAEVEAINELIEQINELGEQGNTLISRFNERVSDFNQTFADGREFTQGDYQDGVINIYSYADQTELRLVLTHELGHALRIPHTDSEADVMYYLLDKQNGYQLTEGDRAAFAAVCSEAARLGTVPQPWRSLFTWLGV